MSNTETYQTPQTVIEYGYRYTEQARTTGPAAGMRDSDRDRVFIGPQKNVDHVVVHNHDFEKVTRTVVFHEWHPIEATPARVTLAIDLRCPACGSPPGTQCRTQDDTVMTVSNHEARDSAFANYHA